MEKHLQTGEVVGTGYKIFVKGSNCHQQCTNEVVDNAREYTRVRAKQIRAPIKHIACGYYHTMIITEEDQLFACGGNSDRQCGIENLLYVPEFTLVPRADSENVRLKQIACGGYFTMLLSEDGQVFGVGQVCCFLILKR
jgi:alpha-tubulin suppressor-like RCC1 family protein